MDVTESAGVGDAPSLVMSTNMISASRLTVNVPLVEVAEVAGFPATSTVKLPSLLEGSTVNSISSPGASITFRGILGGEVGVEPRTVEETVTDTLAASFLKVIVSPRVTVGMDVTESAGVGDAPSLVMSTIKLSNPAMSSPITVTSTVADENPPFPSDIV